MPLTPAEERRWRELGKAILAELATLRRPLDSLVRLLNRGQNADSSEGNEAQATQSAQHKVPAIATIRAETEFPSDLVKEHRAHQQQSGNLQKRTFWVGVLTLVAITMYALITYKQWRTMNEQWIEMRRSVNSTEQQFRISNRPWLGVSEPFITITNPPSFSVREKEQNPIDLTMDITYPIKNFGNGPAVRVVSSFSPVATDTRGPLPPRWMDLACRLVEEVSRDSASPTHSVLPGGDVLIQTHHATFRVPKNISEIQIVWITGCIAYQDIFGQMHHTRLLYRSKSADNAKPALAVSHPRLTYLPIAGMNLWDTSAD